ncbi:MAG: carbon starvation protein A [Tannerellaceae bacterium]|jgi:carbon starvation protein CstA|nr:carbon starvation protein A [Tannerellaceae bacterium]
MITFILSILLLIGGYAGYGYIVERVFGADAGRPTPAVEMADGVDYVPMGWGKIFLIQFLNIAGLGPIFGAVMGAVYGPAAFLWIVFGSIFGGAAHDYLSGMMSARNKGMSLPELGGACLGNAFKQFMRGFAVLLMVLVGAVFIAGPSKLLAGLTPDVFGYTFWCVAIFIYYVVATMLPIDKVIGRIYPAFGFALLFMAIGIGSMIIIRNAPVPEATPANLYNMHSRAEAFPIFPMLFISIACGAVSGFHATQSPLMARCLRNEKHGRRVFYGAMIAEGIVALIWAAAAMSFFGSVGGLQEFLAANDNNAAAAVDSIARSWLGRAGGLLAIVGVIAAPITSGDTAFRSARLIVADFLGYPQKPLLNRALIALPLFAVGFVILQMNFEALWRYFAWANQTLAAATLWVVTVYLYNEKKCFWISLFPAIFMTMVVATYIAIAPEGFRLPPYAGYIAGGCVTMGITAWLRFRILL